VSKQNVEHAGKIRVLRVMARFNLGGPAQQITSLMTHLNRDVFEQKLVVGLCAPDEIDYSEIRNLDFSIERNIYLGRKISLFSDFLAILTMARTYYRSRPHIVHSHTTKAGVICRLARFFYFPKVDLVHTFHGHLLYGYFNTFQTKFIINLEKLLAVITTKLITVGYRVKNELVDAGIAKSSKFLVIPPGICFIDVPHKNRSKGGEVKPSLLIGFVGRVTKIKRPDRFLEIVERIKGFDCEISFLVAGEGSLLDEMKRYSETRGLGIKFLGWISDVEPLFDELDILILTSDNEGTPISIVQGAAHECISLSTEVGSVEDVLIDGETGYICSTVDEFVQKIQFLYSNPSVLSTMKQEARVFSRKNFSGTRLARDHEKLYREIIQS